jgi:O-methyltransferase
MIDDPQVIGQNNDISATELRDRYLELLQDALTASLYDESAWLRVVPSNLGWNPIHWLRRGVKNLLLKQLAKDSIQLVKVRPFDALARERGFDWPLFGFSMAGTLRLENIRQCVKDVLDHDVPGDFIETGAWRGGATIFMRALLKVYGVSDRKVWVADSFEGLPPPADPDDGWDLSNIDYLKVSIEQVKANFARFGLLDDQVAFLHGWFCDTLPNAPIDRLSILRLDGDLYHSTMDALTYLYPKLSEGGYVIVDDYYSWPACRRAITEFLEVNAIKAEIRDIDGTAVYWQRVGSLSR